MLGIGFPLVAFSHCRDVIAAVSRAGGFGVFDLTGKPPTFFFCDATFDDNFFELADLASENVTFDCQVASGCAALPCEVEWHPIGGAPITLPGSFFLP